MSTPFSPARNAYSKFWSPVIVSGGVNTQIMGLAIYTSSELKAELVLRRELFAT